MEFHRMWAALIAVVSLLALCLAPVFGRTVTYVDTMEGAQYTVLKSTYATVNYCLLIFAITNWPGRPRW